MSSEPLFSIITVSYNAAALLEKTIQSVAEQSLRDHLQYIVVDGASNDGTHELLQRRSADIDLCVSEPDSGIYDAMNKGLALATGKYVCFMNAGDTFYNSKTLELLHTAGETLFDRDIYPGVLYGKTIIVDADGKSLGGRRLKIPNQLSWTSFKKGMLVCHQAFYARRDLVPLYDLRYRYSSDFDWCVRILMECTGLNAPLKIDAYVCRYLSEGATTRHHKASLIERWRIMVKHYGFFSTLWQHFYFFFIRRR